MSLPSRQDQCRILVIGEAVLDVVTYPDGTGIDRPGGSPANVAVTLGRLGYRPGLLTSIGRDPAGTEIHCWLKASGVELDPASWRDSPSSIVRAVVNAEGVAEYALNVRWEPRRPTRANVDCLHVGSISAVFSAGVGSAAELIAGSDALFTYDPNIRPALMAEVPDARARVAEIVRVSDVVKASDEDLAWIDPHTDPDATASRWLQEGPELVVLTRGSEGATAFTLRGRVDLPIRPTTVVDTVGAGDTIMGALLGGLASLGVFGGGHDRSRDRLRELSLFQLERLLGEAIRAASITVSRAGADPPWRFEMADSTLLLGLE